MTANPKITRFLSGFTLELIVAMALMDVIAVVLYSSMHIGFKAKKTSQASLRPFQSITPAMEFIRRDLVSAARPDGILAGIFLGEDHPGADNLDTDTLSFYTTGYRPADGEVSSNIVRIGYVLESDLERSQMVLKRLITTHILSPTETVPAEEIICRDIVGLDMTYYDGSDWVDEWDSSTQNSQLPWGVRVTLTLYNEEESASSDDGLRDFTRIFLLPAANQAEGNQEGGMPRDG